MSSTSIIQSCVAGGLVTAGEKKRNDGNENDLHWPAAVSFIASFNFYFQP